VFGIFFNAAENKAFAQLPVRKALSLVIDRERLTNDVLGGYATPIIGPVPPGSGVPALTVPVSEDRLLEARTILEDGGWAFNEETGLWTHAKEELELSVTLKTSNVPELKAVAEAAKEDWEALGVPVTLELYDPGSLTQNVIRPRAYQALLFGMVVGRDRDLFAFWGSSERNDPGLNIALYANRTVDELLERIRTARDPDAVTADLARANELIAEDYPAAFTHAPDFTYVAPKGMRGVVLPQVTAPSDRFATVATWYRHTHYVWPFLQSPNE
jgi:ABC-type transport system substrate-binding protein